jgi:hypothetical protein
MKKNKNSEQTTIKDSLNESVFAQLKQKKKDLEKEEVERKEEEMRRKAEEKRIREKNKSFEELLNESDLSWKEFKK